MAEMEAAVKEEAFKSGSDAGPNAVGGGGPAGHRTKEHGSALVQAASYPGLDGQQLATTQAGGEALGGEAGIGGGRRPGSLLRRLVTLFSRKSSTVMVYSLVNVPGVMEEPSNGNLIVWTAEPPAQPVKCVVTVSDARSKPVTGP